MNWVDYVILAILGISVIIGLVRGFTREALSLAGWIIAIGVTINFTDQLQDLLVPYFSSKPVRIALAVVILFLFTLLVAAMVNYLALALLDKSGLTGTDRMIGVVFGFLRGFALIVVLVLLSGLTDFPKESGWRQSQLMHYFQSTALWLRQFVPREVATNIRY
jgi:membrane protein required for colicin V production